MYSPEQHPAPREPSRAESGLEHGGEDLVPPSNSAPDSRPELQPPVSIREPGIGQLQDQSEAAHRKSSHRLWATAASFALVLTVLTIAGFYLITKKSSTVDQLVILTVPSGAEVKLDSKEYGHSPVKLEKVPIGNYTLTITKEGFEPKTEQIIVAESASFEYRLTLLPPPEAAGLAPEEQIKQFQQGGIDSFARGHYAIPYDYSALYYADQILGIDQGNQLASEMRERIQKTMHQLARSAAARGDLGRAQEIYQVLVDSYPGDDAARTAAYKLENQLSSRRGEVRDLVTKAQEALDAGRLADPEHTSAYYYSKQALARDSQNAEARAIRESVKEKLSDESEQTHRRGDIEAAIKKMERVTQLFPEDKGLRLRLRGWMAHRTQEVERANDPSARRGQGLAKATREDFSGAIPDLEFAVTNGQGTADVIVALARAYHRLGDLDQAENYYRKVPQAAGSSYRSSIGALGDIAKQRGDKARAVARYREALQLGGSILYPPEKLQNEIDTIEKQQREKAAEPTPLAIRVKHLHGKLRGTCSGTLSVNSTGVRYDSSEDTSSFPLAGTSVAVARDKLIIHFQKNSEEFKASSADAQRFQEALDRYHTAMRR